MKIGILTYHNPCNYGANLQAYSTFCALKKRSFKPFVINWFPKEFEERYRRAFSAEQFRIHEEFSEEKLCMTNRCFKESDIASQLQNLGISNVIFGSDAILHTVPFIKRFGLSKKTLVRISKSGIMTNFPNPFWGSFTDFMDTKPTMQMMSVSCQNTPFRLFSPFTIDSMKKRLSAFSYISVRDEWTQAMISYITGGNVVPEITPDPVFNFEENIDDIPDEESFGKKFGLEPKKYVLLGFKKENAPDKNWFIEFRKIVEDKGLKCIHFPMPELLPNVDYQIGKNITPLDWYSLIKHSFAYVGNNMHPLVMAIHNKVRFFAFDQYGIKRLLSGANEQSSKIYHILKSANMLEYRTRAIKRELQIPAPAFVWDKIENFDMHKCEKFSDMQRNKYKSMMDKICKNFTK